jgi:hypothetical protein
MTGTEDVGGANDIFWGWINDSGQIGIQSGNDMGATSTTNVSDGTWHHVAFTYNSSTGETEVYVNGTREDTATTRTGSINDFNSLGRIENTDSNFTGRLDELRIYDHVLSADEITEFAGGEPADKPGTYAETGTLVTDWHTGPMLAHDDLKLDTVDTELNGENVTVIVESDTNDDGSTDETSDPITLDGSEEYAVEGISTDNQHFRLRIELSTNSTSVTPAVDGIKLTE